MQDDEKAIRSLVDTWLAATRSGDLATVLSLMSDDVIFMVPGQQPFGKEVFAANSKSMKGVRIEATSDIKEIKVLGEWAWMRNYLKVTVTPPNEKTTVRSGYSLTILRKNRDGKWLLCRDANLVS